MKKTLLLCLLLMSPAFAYENYIIITDTPYSRVNAVNEDILRAKPIYTLYNSKNIITVVPVKEGKTKINIEYFGKKTSVDVTVAKDKTVIKPHDGMNYYSLDVPPGGIELPKPPKMIDLFAPPKCDEYDNKGG